MSKTTIRTLAIVVIALIAFGIVYATRQPAMAPVVDTPIVDTTTPPVAETPAPSTASPATPAVTTKSPVVGEWGWEKTVFVDGSINPGAGSNQPIVPAAGTFVATFSSDLKFSSTTDCNSLMGKYIVDGEILSIGPIASTKMACGAGSLESEYVKELGRATSFVIIGNELRINLIRDTGTMIFTRRVKAVDPAPTAQLNGSTFRLASFNNVAVATNTNYTLAFKDGNLSAKFCNGLGGTYTVTNGTLKANQLIGTLMYCDQAGLMNMESTFGTVVGAGAKIEQQGNTLTLTGSKGEKFVYTRSS